MYKAICFDLDGTLLPMDMKTFTEGYYGLLAKKVAYLGIEPKPLVAGIWAGVKAMVLNDGSQSNLDAFWACFEQTTGIAKSLIKADCDEFYGKEFHGGKAFTRENPLARKAVELARTKAEKVVLATNPLFPMEGQRTRLSWLGLTPEDFDLVTSYETDCFCKPNPRYFLSVCERIGVNPADCLMIGNDEDEDGYAATKAGMAAYLVTDCLIPSEKHPWQGKAGSFTDLLAMLETL